MEYDRAPKMAKAIPILFHTDNVVPSGNIHRPISMVSNRRNESTVPYVNGCTSLTNMKDNTYSI